MLNMLKGLKYFEKSVIIPYQPVNLHSMLMICGYSYEATPEYIWDGLKRGDEEFILWQYTIDGFGELIHEGKKFKVTPGMGMLLHFPHDSFYCLPSNSPFWKFIYVCFKGREAVRLCRELEKSAGPLSIFTEESRSVHALVDILKKVSSGEVNDPCLCSSLCYNMVTSLIFDLNPHTGERSMQPKFISKVVNYCGLHLDESLSVNVLSKVAGLSRFHFSRLFAEYMKVPPATFVRDLRLEQAVRLLQTEHLNISFSLIVYNINVLRECVTVSKGGS